MAITGGANLPCVGDMYSELKYNFLSAGWLMGAVFFMVNARILLKGGAQRLLAAVDVGILWRC